MIRYALINVVPRKIIELTVQVWEIHDNLLDAEKAREKYLKEIKSVNADNLQVIQFTDYDS